MKFADLQPRWIGSEWAGLDGRSGIGIAFRCPLHLENEHDLLVVYFANPLDGGTAYPGDGYRWQRQGDTFANLTLTPSVDASKHGCWHGFVTNGEVTTC